MKLTTLHKTLFVVLPLAVLASGWFIQQTNTEPTSASTANTTNVGQQTTAEPTVVPPKTQHSSAMSVRGTETATGNNASQLNTAIVPTDTSTSAESELIDPYFIGTDPLSDSDFTALRSLLKQNPDLLTGLLAEYRLNTDPDRAKRLAMLLGDLDDPQIVQTAAELVYSGNPDSQRMGLDLLSRLQPHSSEARDIAIELLSSVTNPTLLVSTLNVLAIPASSVNTEQRSLLVDNLTLLTSHLDPRVRSHSISLLGKWDKGSFSNNTLLQGLTDSNPTVRARSASALRTVPDPDEYVIHGLLELAENSDEKKTTRQSALYSLKNMPMNDESRTRYIDAVTEVRRTRNKK